ncbi:unnamed protein product [Closterium sp. NIES-54]
MPPALHASCAPSSCATTVTTRRLPFPRTGLHVPSLVVAGSAAIVSGVTGCAATARLGLHCLPPRLVVLLPPVVRAAPSALCGAYLWSLPLLMSSQLPRSKGLRSPGRIRKRCLRWRGSKASLESSAPRGRESIAHAGVVGLAGMVGTAAGSKTGAGAASAAVVVAVDWRCWASALPIWRWRGARGGDVPSTAARKSEMADMRDSGDVSAELSPAACVTSSHVVLPPLLLIGFCVGALVGVEAGLSACVFISGVIVEEMTSSDGLREMGRARAAEGHLSEPLGS